jgi:hypothetical protein
MDEELLFRVEFDDPVFNEERKERTMLKVRLAVMSLAIAMMLPLVSVLQAQAPAAPIPSQILTAKKVFISNAGAFIDQKIWTGGTAQPYNELYAALKSWGHFELLAAPADADLVLQISYEDPLTRVNVVNGTGGDSDSPQFKLALVDTKTHIVLWTLYESTSISHLQKGRDQALQDAINKLVDDLKALTIPPAAAMK